MQRESDKVSLSYWTFSSFQTNIERFLINFEVLSRGEAIIDCKYRMVIDHWSTNARVVDDESFCWQFELLNPWEIDLHGLLRISGAGTSVSDCYATEKWIWKGFVTRCVKFASRLMSGAVAIQGGKKRITNICEIQHVAVNRVNCPVSDRSGVPCEIQPFTGASSVSHASFHTGLIDCCGNTEHVRRTQHAGWLNLRRYRGIQQILEIYR